MANRNLLMVCFYFPPCGGVAVQRSLKFAKYLGQFGWSPIILTEDSCAFGHLPQDPGLLDQLDAETQVIRTPNGCRSGFYRWAHRLRINRLVDWLTPIDMHFAWALSAIGLAKRWPAEKRPDAVYTTSPPASAHLVGLWLSRLWGVPWVADFRDPWTQWHSYRPRTRIHRALDEWLERRIADHADVVISTTATSRDMLLDKYGQGLSDRAIVLPNGYDPDDAPAITCPRDAQRLTITYIGTLYGTYGDPADRLFPQALFDGLARIVREKPDAAAGMLVRFVGAFSEDNARIVSDNGLEDVVELVGPVPHARALQYAADSDANLVLLNECQRNLIPAKVFEMVGVGRPIVAVVPDGDARRLMSDLGIPYLADPGDPDTVTGVLTQVFADWESKALAGFRYEPSRVEQYNRRRLAEQLAAQLDAVTSTPRATAASNRGGAPVG